MEKMKIMFNGEPRTVGQGLTVTALLVEMGVQPGRIAVEINGQIVSKAEHETIRLAAGDRVEVVSFVGGG